MRVLKESSILTTSPLTWNNEEITVLLGDVSPKINSDGTNNGLSTLVADIRYEDVHDPVAMIGKMITDEKQFLTNFIVARITAIRGYFDEIFAKKIHTDELCVKKSDGSEVCVNGDQLNELLPSPTPSPTAMPQKTSQPSPTTTTGATPSETPISTPTPTESMSPEPATI